MVTAQELKLRKDRLTYSKDLLGALCAFENLVLDLMKVSGLSEKDAEAELVNWLQRGVPFQETIDAYICGGPPEILSDQVALNA